eukprot:12335159-Alexandrium_andersonii.AAC.1
MDRARAGSLRVEVGGRSEEPEVIPPWREEAPTVQPQAQSSRQADNTKRTAWADLGEPQEDDPWSAQWPSLPQGSGKRTEGTAH